MPYRRGSRRMGRRSSMPRAVIQSQKMWILKASASNTGGTQALEQITIGTDDFAGGQTSSVDKRVPTGAVIKEIHVFASFVNLSAVANFLNWGIQILRTNQTASQILAWGGDAKRNQILLVGQRSLGESQSVNVNIVFKIPRMFQRVREGDTWNFIRIGSATWSDQLCFLLKYYR